MKSFDVDARLLKVSFLLLIVGTISLHGQNVSSSRKLCIQLDDDDDVQKSLTSSKNYYNISRAFFPSPGNPSMYVKIFVQFNSSSSRNNTNSLKVGNQKKYTWSKSCLYVATQFISLSAINVYSVGAVWPNRRGAELSITIPEFCNATKEEINAKMIYFLSTLEDVAINNKTQDPRLNTAECVVEGHDDFSIKIFSGVRQLLMCVCWCFGIISIVVGFVMSNLVISWLEARLNKETEESSQTTTTEELKSRMKKAVAEIIHQQDNDGTVVIIASNGQKEDGKKSKIKADSVQFLICFLAVTEHILAVVAFCASANVENIYPLVYFLILHVGFLIYYYWCEKGSCDKKELLFLLGPSGGVSILVCNCLKRRKKRDELDTTPPQPPRTVKYSAKEETCEILIKDHELDTTPPQPSLTMCTVIHLTLLMSVHHFLWILLGVVTEPLWAIPVIVFTSCFWFCIYLSAYYFKKSELDKELRKCKVIAPFIVVVSCIMLALLVLGVTAQSFLGTDPITVIVSSAVPIIASWFLKKLI